MSAQLKVSAPLLIPVEFDPFANEAQSLAFVAPCTEAQQELWNAAQLGPDASCAFNECVSLRFQGAVNVSALQRALTLVVQRNEGLRMTFAPGGEELCVSNLPLYDFQHHELDESGLQNWRREAVETPFDLVHGPLLRAWLASLSVTQSELIISVHHIVCDGWSMGILIQELAAIYSAEVTSQIPKLEKTHGFFEYAELQERYLSSADFQVDQKFWIEKFEHDLPSLDLPLDYSRPVSRGYASQREELWIAPETLAPFKKLAARYGCSLSAAAQAVFHILLSRLSGETSIVVGLPVAGQLMFEREKLVGHCVNLLPIRAEINLSIAFSEFLKNFKATIYSALDHQKYTYGTLLKNLPISRDPSRMPLVSVMFNIDPGLDSSAYSFAGLKANLQSNARSFENFEIFINGVVKDGGLVLEAQYKTELFTRETIVGWLQAYQQLLLAFVSNPSTAIGQAPMLGDQAFKRVLHDWNATAVPTQDLLLVHEAIAAHALKTPQAIAITDSNGSINYETLEARSNQLARYLMDLGVKPGSLVGVAVERSAEMVIALLGVLKAGGAYLPLDPDYPPDRLEYMLTLSKTSIVVTDSIRKDQLPLGNSQAICVDTDRAAIERCLQTPLTDRDGVKAGPLDVAYVIFTSGSTGLPKGVQVLHLGVANFLRSMQRKPGISAIDVQLAITTLSFDIAVLELYLPLISGARVVVATREAAMDAHQLGELIDRERVTVMQATPATWRMLLAAGWQGQAHLKALCGGEALTRDLAAALLSKTRELWNMYGPTETTVWSTCQKIVNANQPISIGGPIDNTQIYILNDAGLPQPPGAAGELFIGGAGVALGYLGRDDLTAERFSPDPFLAGGRIYRTGDLARWRSDGLLEHLGRNDAQVKVRGFRIELGEIEASLMSTALLSECSVIVREDTPGDQRLVAYFASAHPLNVEELKISVQQKLPAYMVPLHWVQMDALPKTLNGKIDRKRLPKPGTVRIAEKQASILPRTLTERFLHTIWKEVLKQTEFGVQENFFLLGGHSLLATQLIARIEKGGRTAPNLRGLFQLQTIEKLAEWIDAQAGAQIDIPARTATSRSSRIPARADQSTAPLSLMQQRVWYLEEINPGTAAYHLPAAFCFNGIFDPQAAQAAWNAIIQRHAALRTAIVIVDGEPIQKIAALIEFALPLIQCNENQMLEQANADAQKLFDLTNAPLVRGALYQLDPQRHVLYFVAHHLVWDGWSFDVFLREFKELYEAQVQQRQARLPELKISYGDFSAWHRGQSSGSLYESEKTFWLQQLGGTLPILDLPTDYPRPAEMSTRGDSLEFHWSNETLARITAFARAHSVTVQMFLLAGFKALLNRLSGVSDVIVGAPIQGRTETEVEDLIGFFVNTLVLRTQIDENATFIQVLEKTRDTCLDAYSHQHMPFESLVEELRLKRDISRTPIFQAFFTYQDVARREWTLDSASITQVNVHTKVSLTDLSLWVKVGSNGVVGAFDYSTDLFERSTIAAWSQRYIELLEHVMAHPALRIAELGTPTIKPTATANVINVSLKARSTSDAGIELTSTERYLIEMWQEYFATAITPADNFFDLGGHSLLSMQMIARIERDTGKRLSPRLILLSSLGQIAIQLGGDKKAATQSNSQRQAVPFFFGPGLFGTYHRPSNGDSRTGVLICAPIAQEYMRTHWLFRQLASSLTRAGIHVFRFDYTGCGDSVGAQLAGGPTQWCADVSQAAKEFKQRSGIQRLIVVGARLGAYLAAAALPEAELVLWDPVESGSDYLNELMSLQREKSGKQAPFETQELAGFEFSSSLRDELITLNLAPKLKAAADRVTILRSHELGERIGWSTRNEWHHTIISPKIVQSISAICAEKSQ